MKLQQRPPTRERQTKQTNGQELNSKIASTHITMMLTTRNAAGTLIKILTTFSRSTRNFSRRKYVQTDFFFFFEPKNKHQPPHSISVACNQIPWKCVRVFWCAHKFTLKTLIVIANAVCILHFLSCFHHSNALSLLISIKCTESRILKQQLFDNICTNLKLLLPINNENMMLMLT